ncbi:MAG: alginate lyase family protein [Gammaproteobacteria bacterium]
MTSPGRYWRTLRHLRLSQIAYQLYYRLVPAPRARKLSGLQRRGDLHALAFAPPVVPDITVEQISFLNSTRPLDVAAMDWAAAAEPKLWRYNLHYFDYLHWRVYPAAMKQQLIDSWIAGNPPTAGDGWEPYPVSLRAVNWIKAWLSDAPEQGVPQARLDSLATQLAWLEKRLEYHLLANHLLKNGKALFFGGVFFSGPEAERWRERGLEILLREADEQILADGGHYECSPMYHCIVLEDYLDVLNLLRAVPKLVPAEAETRLRAAAGRALQFLADITAGDGRIPLFNDAAFGIAPEPAVLLDYGSRVAGAASAAPTAIAAPARIDLPDTGYYGYRQGGDSLIVDCGPVGPDYQPGHTHCDTLSYELCVAGRRVVVDAGTHSYGIDGLRHHARRTSSHNTVQLDGVEQSEIWGAFRVGRRARPLQATLSAWQDGRLLFSGSHDGYRHLPGQPRHERRIVMAIAGRWEIHDLITGNAGEKHQALSCIHLDPSFMVQVETWGTFMLLHAEGGLALRLTVTCGSATRLAGGYHFPEFGLCRENSVICVERTGVLPIEMHYRIERL